MREIAEREAWRRLGRSSSAAVSLTRIVPLDGGVQLALDKRCLVLAGFNGAGKSMTLDAISRSLLNESAIVRLHEICEQVRSVLRSRSDIEQMEAEVGPMSIEKETVQSLSRVIGRDYDNVEWYGLELEPTYEGFAGWPTSDDQMLMPHFRVEHEGVSYSSLQMGLGEFSVHLLFWILWQLRDSPGKVILLDEPDAYLPPSTRMRFVALLLAMAEKYDWQVVMTSHSEELISAAYENDALIVLSRHGGIAHCLPSAEYGLAVVRELVSQPSADLMLFCEDESAAALVRAILHTYAADLAETTAVIWKDGDGYLRKLAQHLPRTDASPVRFSLVFDGDQRPPVGEGLTSELSRWPTMYLPTAQSPDALFRTSKADPVALRESLRCNQEELRMALDALQGSDDHDWVNGLCRRFGPRTATLDALAGLWVLSSGDHSSAEFCELLRNALPRPSLR